MWSKENICTLLVGMQIGAATVESSMEVPQKIKNGTALWPNNSTAGNMLKETQNTNSEYMAPIFTAAIFTIAKIWMQPKSPLVNE